MSDSREWFGALLEPSDIPTAGTQAVRWWDLAASESADAARLHAALGASLARIGVALAPELLIAVGLAEPPRSAQGDDGDSRSTRGAGPGSDRNTGRVP